MGVSKTQLAQFLRRLVAPKVLIPTLLTAALFYFAFSISDIGEVFGRIGRLSPLAIGVCFTLALIYLVVKGYLFHMLLRGVGVSVAWRKLTLAYSIGEMTVPLPAGVYLQNYVLRHIHGDRFALTAAATSATLIIEELLILVALLVMPIPGWNWVRPLILEAFVIIFITLILLRRFRHFRSYVAQRLRSGRVRSVGIPILDMLGAMRRLATVPVLVSSLGLSAVYLFTLAAAFYITARGVGLDGLTYDQATSIYFFSLAVVLLVGSFVTQLGAIEVVGLSVAQAWGYSPSEGFAALLGFRLIWVGSIWLLCGPAMFALRREFKRRVDHE